MPSYQLRAPELSGHDYSYNSDLWGVGIIAFKLMTQKDLFKRGQSFKYWKINLTEKDVDISFNFLDFVHQTVMEDHKLRTDPKKLLNHAFILYKPKLYQMTVKDFLMYGYMRNYINQNLLRRLIINGNLRF